MNKAFPDNIEGLLLDDTDDEETALEFGADDDTGRACGGEIHNSCEIYESNEKSQAIAYKCHRVQIHVRKRVLEKTRRPIGILFFRF